MPNQVAYGFLQMKDLFDRRVNEVGVNQIADAIEASVAEHNRQMDNLISLFCEKTTQFKERYQTPVGARLQPLDDNGRARPIKPFGRYDVAYPLFEAGVAWGANYRTREKMTVSDANLATTTMQDADAIWMRDHILAALFANAPYNHTDDLHGTLEIKGLANNDPIQYLIQAGADSGAQDTHYLAQTAAISDTANPFPVIEQELSEHPENTGQVVAFIPTNLKTATMNLSNFLDVVDPNVRLGSGQNALAGSLGVAHPGTLLGYYDKVWIVEWKGLPDNYIVATTTQGAKTLALREEPESSLRGFKKVAERNDHPFYESQYLRIAGFGARNRVGSLVYQIGVNNYAVPANYGSPMP